MRTILTALTAAFAISTSHPAQSEERSVGDCFQDIEAMHMAMDESNLPDKDLAIIDIALTRAAGACDANKLEEGTQALKDANELYNAAIAEANGDVTPHEFWQKADYYWGNRSYRKGIQFKQAMISCDDKMDYVAWYLNLDNPDNPGFDVLAVTKNDLGDIKTAHVTLPLGEGQYSICHREGASPPNVYLDEEVHEGLALELGGIDVCPQIIRIDDGMCDTIRLMWPQDDIGEELPFVLHRN